MFAVSEVRLLSYLRCVTQGRIQDFKLGGAHFKKLRRAEGGAKNVGVFRVKITILRQKILFFPIIGGAPPPPPPPPDPSLLHGYE